MIRSVTTQKAVPDSERASKPERDSKPREITAFLLNPACEHNWAKLADDCQTLESEGKTIWKCRSCSEITTTYGWREPTT